MKKFQHAQRLYIYSGYIFSTFAATGLVLKWFPSVVLSRVAKISSVCALAVLIVTLLSIPLALIFDCLANKEAKTKIIWLILLIFVLLALIAVALFFVD